MPNYKLTPEADRDIKAIIRYTIKNWGKSQAHKYIDGLEELMTELSESPSLGLRQDYLSKGLYRFPYQSHSVYYKEIGTDIVVIRVLHQRMDAEEKIKSGL